MIHFNLSLTNPWSQRWLPIYFRHGSTPIPNKFWELEIVKSNHIIAVSLDTRIYIDHSGFSVSMALLGYHVEFVFYDQRHRNEDRIIYL